MSFYSEMFPIAALAFFGTFFFKILQSKEKVSWFISAVIIFGLTIILSNVEVYRMGHAIISQLHGVVGGNVPFSLIQFWGFASGINPDIANSPLGICQAFSAVILIIFSIGFVTFIKKYSFKNLVWSFTFLIYAAMFVYFAFFVENPWAPGTLGQTWDMFKITNWIYPILLLGIVFGIYSLPKSRVFLFIFVVLMILISLPFQNKMAKDDTAPIRAITFSNNPFSAYQQCAEVIQSMPDTKLVEIQMGTALPVNTYIKHRQMIAYFLYPYPVVSDWSIDGYSAIVPSINRNFTLNEPHLIIQPRTNTASKNILPAGFMITSSTNLMSNH